MKQPSPGIISSSEFYVNGYTFFDNGASHSFSSELKQYKNYIEYLDRESVRADNCKAYKSFVSEYMDNSQKAYAPEDQPTNLFTAKDDVVSLKQKEEIKKQFSQAQQNQSPLWKTVFSFTDEFLRETGIVTGEYLDQMKLKEAVRCGMKTLLEQEHMESSAVWTASIHCNTDHVHVHLAIAEPIPTRKKCYFRGKQQYRGKWKPSTLYRMKSTVTNNVYDRKEELSSINEIIRENLTTNFKRYDPFHDKLLGKKLQTIAKALPHDRRLWRYHMNALKEVRPLIDDLSDTYLNAYQRKEYQQLTDKLLHQDKINLMLYGKSKTNRLYSQTKLDELHTRMGNAVLAHIKKAPLADDGSLLGSGSLSRLEKNISLCSGMFSLKKALRKNFESVKNERVYNELQQQIHHALQTGEEMEHW